MPKEVVHWGKLYKLVKHESTPNTSEYWEEFEWDGTYQVDGNGEPLPLPPNTEVARKPSIEIIWQRPQDRAPVAYDEDPEGTVQIGMVLDRVDMKNHLRYDDERDSVVTFFTGALTRRQINEMIRTLKRARNAALGADE